MVVLILERVSASMRGELSRWMLEPRAGVFVGKLSAMVRDRLWEKALKGARGGAGAAMIFDSNTEQGFTVRSNGDTSRMLADWEGLTLVTVPYRDRSPTGSDSADGGGQLEFDSGNGPE
jgi:CRISPR-associated protein Cas2